MLVVPRQTVFACGSRQAFKRLNASTFERLFVMPEANRCLCTRCCVSPVGYREQQSLAAIAGQLLRVVDQLQKQYLPSASPS